jgi:hypothetical protein
MVWTSVVRSHGNLSFGTVQIRSTAKAALLSPCGRRSGSESVSGPLPSGVHHGFKNKIVHKNRFARWQEAEQGPVNLDHGVDVCRTVPWQLELRHCSNPKHCGSCPAFALRQIRSNAGCSISRTSFHEFMTFFVVFFVHV